METSQRYGFKSLGTSEIYFEVWVSMSLMSESSGTLADKNPYKKEPKEEVGESINVNFHIFYLLHK